MFYDTASNAHGLPHDPFKAIVTPRPIGWITATAFLTVNGAVSRRRLAALDQDVAYDLVIAVCTGELREIEDIAQALRELY